MGIVGASLVGRRVLELLRPYDLDLLLYDPYVDEAGALALGARAVTLDKLCACRDVVSVHAPELPATHHLVSRAMLALMRDGATLVNTARGSLVDQDALVEELVAGRLHAVLDVTTPEVLPADSPLYELPNVLLTPHVAGSIPLLAWVSPASVGEGNASSMRSRGAGGAHCVVSGTRYGDRVGSEPGGGGRSRALKRSYTFLLRPTSRQSQALTEMLRDHCSLYNGALQERRDAYRHTSKTSVSYGQQSAQLKEIRAFDPERQGRWSFSSQQATLRRLDKAFAAFFRRRKAGEKPGYPRFKGLGRFDTVDFPKDGDGCRWNSTAHDPVVRVRLQGVGHVRVHQHRPIKGRVKTVSVKREGKRWYVILSCDEVPPQPLPETGAEVGIDMGTVHFLTTSEGEHVPNPRYLAAAAEQLAQAQRRLDVFPKKLKAGKRTKRHRAAARRVAKLHAKIRRQRLDYHHKTALDLVRDHDVIAREQLNIAGMTRAPQAKPDPEQPGSFLPNGAAAKTGLNKSILDAGWGQFFTILASKAESAGRQVIVVDARNTSRTCPPAAGGCGHVSADNRVTQAAFKCTECGFTANADHVGALNVLDRAGLALCATA